MNIVIIDAVSSGFTYFSAAERLKIGIYAFCSKKEDYLLKNIKEIVEIDTSDFNSQLSKIIDLDDVDAIIPGVEYAVEMASKLGKSCGKNFLNIETAQIVRNKYLFRERLTDKELSDIKYFEIKHKQKSFIRSDMCFPVVIKPVDMAGSMRVRKVDNHEDLIELVEDIWNSLPEDVGFLSSGDLIVEEYISGEEFSVEGIVHKNGNITILSITEKLLGTEPYFVEIGHIVGQFYTKEFKDNIMTYTRKVISAINMNIGPFHLELRISSEGKPVAIELAARLPGDNIVELIRLSTGIDLAMANICEYLNISQNLEQTVSNVAAIAFITEDNKQIVQGVSRFEEYFDCPEYVDSEIYIEQENQLETEKDWTSRRGHVIFSGKNEKTIKKLVKSVHEKVHSI